MAQKVSIIDTDASKARNASLEEENKINLIVRSNKHDENPDTVKMNAEKQNQSLAEEPEIPDESRKGHIVRTYYF